MNNVLCMSHIDILTYAIVWPVTCWPSGLLEYLFDAWSASIGLIQLKCCTIASQCVLWGALFREKRSWDMHKKRCMEILKVAFEKPNWTRILRYRVFPALQITSCWKRLKTQGNEMLKITLTIVHCLHIYVTCATICLGVNLTKLPRCPDLT